MTEHAVVIAGGGPTGLMLAGVDVAIVERRASQNLIGLRAGCLHARTIEVLRSARNRRSVALAGPITGSTVPPGSRGSPTRHGRRRPIAEDASCWPAMPRTCIPR